MNILLHIFYIAKRKDLRSISIFNSVYDMIKRSEHEYIVPIPMKYYEQLQDEDYRNHNITWFPYENNYDAGRYINETYLDPNVVVAIRKQFDIDKIVMMAFNNFQIKRMFREKSIYEPDIEYINYESDFVDPAKQSFSNFPDFVYDECSLRLINQRNIFICDFDLNLVKKKLRPTLSFAAQKNLAENSYIVPFSVETPPVAIKTEKPVMLYGGSVLDGKKNIDIIYEIGKNLKVMNKAEFILSTMEKSDDLPDYMRDDNFIHIFTEQNRFDFLNHMNKSNFFVCASHDETGGNVYFEMLFAGMIGFFLEEEWTKSLLPDYPFIYKNQTELQAAVNSFCENWSHDKYKEYRSQIDDVVERYKKEKSPETTAKLWDSIIGKNVPNPKVPDYVRQFAKEANSLEDLYQRIKDNTKIDFKSQYLLHKNAVRQYWLYQKDNNG